jgi:hypothetical protein
MAGKGSSRRPEVGTKYQDEWERIFGSKEQEKQDILDELNPDKLPDIRT